MTSKQLYWIFYAVFSITGLLFLKDFVLLQGTFNLGDFQVQHYPWAAAYAESLRAGTLPLWTPWMHTGFPLMAEGQIGVFYPIHLVLFSLLPFKIAYNINIVLHFLLAGLFLFFYLRHLRLSPWSLCIGLFIWVFGSAYAGVVYNFATMRVLIWLPVVLLGIDKVFIERKLMWSFALITFFFFQMTAGYTQFAFYSICFSSLYFLCTLLRSGSCRFMFNGTLIYGVIGLLAAGLASIQLLPSMELSDQTLRFTDATIDFAMLGSFSPLTLFSVLFPWVTRSLAGFRLYSSIGGLFFICMAVFAYKNRKFYILYFLLSGLLFLSFSFGNLNPLYEGIISLFKLYFFRTPGKWTIFVSFCLAVLAAFGAEAFVNGDWKSRVFKKARIWFSTVVLAGVGVFLVSGCLLAQFKSYWIQLGRKYVDANIYGAPFHRHALDHYYEKVQSIYDGLVRSFQFDFHNIAGFLFMAIMLMLIWSRWFEKRTRMVKGLFIVLIVVDLFIFSGYGTGLRGNIGDMDHLDSHELADFLKIQPEKGRLYLYSEDSAERLQLGLAPDENIMWKLDLIGAYSPLITKHFTNYLEELGDFDDSLGNVYVNESRFLDNLPLLNVANVRYVYAPKALSYSNLDFLKQTSSGNYLYENRDVLPKAYFVTQAKQHSAETALPYMRSPEFEFKNEIILETESLCAACKADFKSEVHIFSYEDQRVEISVKTTSAGWLVLSDLYFPGWRVTVDGHESPLLRANYLFRAVYVAQGEHRVIFKYEPESLKKGIWVSSISLLIILLGLIIVAAKIIPSDFKE